MVIPDEAGIGQAPQRFAKAASERIRSGVIAEDDQQLSRGVGAHTEALAEGRCCRGGETREVLVVQRDFLGESLHRRASDRRVCLADAMGVSMGPGRSPAQRVSRP